ncbi:MAG: SigE family RNA polymerase sigma factor [Sporichthyaceae bacterium]
MRQGLGFDAFYADAYPRVLRAVAPLAGTSAEAQDATQEAFARAYVRWAAVSEADSPEAWVIRVGKNLAISRLRRLRVAARHLFSHREEATDPMPGVVNRVDLVSALDGLPPKQRQILGLHYLEDVSVQDIATRMDMTPGNVKVNLHRGRAALRERLEGGGTHGAQ